MLGKLYILFICAIVIILTAAHSAQAQINSNLLQRAQSGDAMAQHRVAYIYHTGVSGEENLAKARFWYDKAAAQGLAKSEFAIARLLTLDTDGPKDYAAALPWVIRAAKPRDRSQGQGFRDSQKFALDMLKWICRNGVASFPDTMRQSKDSYCLYRRGRKLYYGSKKYGVERDYMAARKYLHKALEKDELRAAKYLMRIYQNGYGTEKNPELYQKMMRIAAEHGDGDAIMAQIHQNRDRLSQDDYIVNLHLAAKDGHYKANWQLGNLYLSSQMGRQDIERALTHYFLAGRTKLSAHHSVFSKDTTIKNILENPQSDALFQAAKINAERIAEENNFSSRKRNRIVKSFTAISAQHKAVQNRGGRIKSHEETMLYFLLAFIAMMGLIRPLRFGIFLGKQWLFRFTNL